MRTAVIAYRKATFILNCSRRQVFWVSFRTANFLQLFHNFRDEEKRKSSRKLSRRQTLAGVKVIIWSNTLRETKLFGEITRRITKFNYLTIVPRSKKKNPTTPSNWGATHGSGKTKIENTHLANIYHIRRVPSNFSLLSTLADLLSNGNILTYLSCKFTLNVSPLPMVRAIGGDKVTCFGHHY